MLEAFELTGEIGLRYMLMFLIIIGTLIAVNVIVTGQPYQYGFMKGILDSVFALVVLVGLVIIARELWFFRSGLQSYASRHEETLKKAEKVLKKLG